MHPMSYLIRLAEEQDAGHILAIYKPFIENTAVSFEKEVPSVDEFWQRINTILEEWPWLVCEIDGVITGYAYASNHRERASYQWTKEVSVYVHPDHQGKGVAKALYRSLLACLELQGVRNVLAGATVPNPGSEGFHHSLGFTDVGTYHNIGFKFGKWHHVQWWEKQLSAAKPREIKLLGEVVETGDFRRKIKSGLDSLK